MSSKSDKLHLYKSHRKLELGGLWDVICSNAPILPDEANDTSCLYDGFFSPYVFPRILTF